MRRARIGVAAALSLLSACTVGPDYRPPRQFNGAPDAAPKLLGASTQGFTDDAPPAQWWHLYESPELDALVQKALTRNAELRSAVATLEAAQAGLREEELQRTPMATLGADASYGQASADELGASHALSPGSVIGLVGSVSYNVDLFGRLRRSIEASRADVGAAQAALDLVRVNLAAGVTGAYATACSAGNQIAVTRRSVTLAQQIVDVTTRRYRGGISGLNDVVRARSLLAQTRATLPRYLEHQRTALYLLATLTGDHPEFFPAEIESCATPPVIRTPIPVGDGASLLRRRPDMREAERHLASAVAEIGVVTSDLYPNISLGGGIGTFATKPRDVFSDRGFHWSLGPLISWNFPNRALARAGIAQKNALARADLATFEATINVSLRETETALYGLARDLDTERELTEARDQAALAARNTERLYAGGIGEFIDTLDAERTLIAADATLADATAQVADRQVQLFLALGGGWEDAPKPEETPLDGVAMKHERVR